MTKREKRLRDLRRTIASWETRREAAIRTLVRSETQLPLLRKRAARMVGLLLKAGTPVEPTITDEMIRTELLPGLMAVGDKPAPEEDDLPEFLDRTGKDKDDEARAEIKAEQEADKKRKAERRIAKLKISQETKHAELTGQRRKMPLTGKEALAAIRAGE